MAESEDVRGLTSALLDGPPPSDGCTDGADNDHNGLTDCDDPTCARHVACAVSPGTSAGVEDVRGLLFGGDPPLQQGADASLLDSPLAGVLRGRVFDEDGQPLSGVAVDVLGRADLGHTWTRTGGIFDLAVHAGSALTIRYTLEGYLPAQRTLRPEAGDFSWLPDVVLIERDAQRTQVEAGAAVVQVARGPAVTDGRGTRQATLVFPAGVTARAKLPNGQEHGLGAMHVRATEYTVGTRGRERMPGSLPPESGYTYAVELSIDEADALDATTVTFSKPVSLYVENFLHFPIGEAVPTGYYDRSLGSWIASPDGIVLGILEVSGGRASVDVNGDGVAESAVVLQRLGLDDADLAQLAVLYTPGQTLWRVRLAHFSAWDCNWPLQALAGALAHLLDLGDEQEWETDRGDCGRAGSIIQCERQVLGEVFGLPGTPHALLYQTDRTRAFRQNYVLDLPLTDETPPSLLERVELQIDVAGQHHRFAYGPESNTRHRFEWDGRDGYGRPVLGEREVVVRIGYVYPGAYDAPATSTSDWLGGSAPLDPNVARSFARSGLPRATEVDATMEVTLWRKARFTLGARLASRDGLGGLTLLAHHAYDLQTDTLFRGDGTKRRARTLGHLARASDKSASGPAWALYGRRMLAAGADGSLYTVDYVSASNTALGEQVARLAPDGTISRFGTLPGDASLTYRTIAVGADGEVYVANRRQHVVYRVASDGTTQRFAGTGAQGQGGLDNTSALTFPLANPTALAVGADGSVYIGESGGHSTRSRILRVDPRGTIVTLFRNESRTVGDINSLAADAQGNLYVADVTQRRVHRRCPDGRFQTLSTFDATGTTFGPSQPVSVAVDAAGNLFVMDEDRTRASGIVLWTLHAPLRWQRIAGGGPFVPPTRFQHYPAGGYVATELTLDAAYGLAVTPDGSIHLSSGAGIMEIAPASGALGNASQDELRVPSEDGALIYVFDGHGRHLRTTDSVLGTTLASFEYDAEGRVTRVLDREGHATRFDRNGNHITVTGPYGQETVLDLDSADRLDGIHASGGVSVSLAYGADGLLSSWTAPGGGVHTFLYDGLGRLEVDQAPDGYRQTLYAEKLPSGERRVTVSATGGQSAMYETLLGERDVLTRRVTARGRTGERTERADGMVEVGPDGTERAVTLSPDPRFGMSAAFAQRASVKLPSGRSTAVRQARQLEGTALQPTRLVQTTFLGSDNRGFQSTWNAAERSVRSVSPLGRQQAQFFDARGRLVRTEVPGHAKTHYFYDADGRPDYVQVGEVGSGARITRYGYRPDGRLERITDPLGRTTRWDRDERNLVTGVVAPGQTVGSHYDAALDLDQFTNASGQAYDFTYSATGRWKTTTAPDQSIQQRDLNPDRTIDRLVQPDGRVVGFGYTDGVLTTTQLERGVVQAFDDDGDLRPDRLVSPDAELGLAWDGPVLEAVAFSGPVDTTLSITLDSKLREGGYSLGGAASVVRKYDADGVLERSGDLGLTFRPGTTLIGGTTLGAVRSEHVPSAFAEPDLSRFYHASRLLFEEKVLERDALGRIIRVRETVDGSLRTLVYGYDPADRIETVTVDGTVIESYGYDPNGNRNHVVAPGMAGSASPNSLDQLLSQGDVTYGYGANRERAARTEGGTTAHYDFDELGSLLRVERPDAATIQYEYDPLGRRIGKRVGDARTQSFVYYDALKPLAEYDGAGVLRSSFVYATRPNVPDYMVKAGQRYRLVTDVRGSVRLVVAEASGAIAQRLDYDTFGRVLRDTNPGFQPFGYAGGLYDPDTELVLFGVRDYDAETGTFLTSDPAGFAGGINLYQYAAGDPVNQVDITGESPQAIGAILGGVILGGGNIASQLQSNGGNWGCIDWGSAASSAFHGALTGAMLGGLTRALVGALEGGLARSLAGVCRGAVCEGGCFTANTDVSTDRGLVPIAEIEPGDQVLALTDVSAKPAYYAVTAITSRPEVPVLGLELAAFVEQLTTTSEHPFYTLKGWRRAGDLAPGDQVYTARGGWDSVVSTRLLGRAETVYNLQVEQAHTYFVGQSQAWVHNTYPPGASGGGAQVANSGAAKAFHHTAEKWVESISRNGLRPGSYATPTPDLSPLQAHIELALNPAGGARNALLEIDLAGLRAAGYEIPAATRVQSMFGMPGGGWEMQFPYAIPAELIKVLTP